jgi:hypothetical protein
MAIDFQMQMSEAARQFRGEISRIENAYRMAPPVVGATMATMDPWAPIQTGRPRKNRDQLDDEPSEDDIEEQICLWKRSSRKRNA